MGQKYTFSDYVNLFNKDESSCNEDINDEDYLYEDGRKDPGKCIICRTPHTACLGKEEE